MIDLLSRGAVHVFARRLPHRPPRCGRAMGLLLIAVALLVNWAFGFHSTLAWQDLEAGVVVIDREPLSTDPYRLVQVRYSYISPANGKSRVLTDMVRKDRAPTEAAATLEYPEGQPLQVRVKGRRHSDRFRPKFLNTLLPF